MSLLDKAKKHYQAKLEAEPRELFIPEWDSKVYIKPGISLLALGEIMQQAQNGNAAEAMALTVIHRLIDGDGKPVFKKSERAEIMRSVDPDILARIVSEINEADPTAEDIEGN